MPISTSNELFALVKSLSKSEKRNFKIFATRFQDTESLKYLQLFNLLEKQKKLDEVVLKKKFNTSQLSNLKRHLFSQILISIRQLEIKKRNTIKVRENIDFATILYGKGLYQQSLKLLKKAKDLAFTIDDKLLLLDITEFQKKIESRHITRSGALVSSELIDEAKVYSKDISNEVLLSNLRLKLQSHYITSGQAINQIQAESIKALFEKQFEKINTENLNYLQQVYFYQAKVRYHHNLVEFNFCLKYAKLWVAILLDIPELIHRDINLLFIGYHYILLSAFYLNDVKTFKQYLPEFENYRKVNYSKFNYNSQILSFIYVHQARLNFAILTADYSLGQTYFQNTLKRLKKYENNLDVHRKMIFYYKAAWIYFATKNFKLAIKYLNQIIYLSVGTLREDIQSYSRLMRLMVNYDDASFDTLHYLKKETHTYFSKLHEKSKLQIETLNFFMRISKAPLLNHKKMFLQFFEELKIINEDIFERRAFLYLDVLSWVKAKVENVEMQKVILKKQH